MYVLFDLPGQVEIFTLHDNLRHIVDIITSKWDYRCVTLPKCQYKLITFPYK